MQIKTIEISGFVSCFNTLRKPFKKECRSSFQTNYDVVENGGFLSIYNTKNDITIHPNDLKLLQRLIKDGDEHSKAVRLINITAEIQAPLFWWSEMDTYEVGVVNGCSESTMHTLKNEKLTRNFFETDIPFEYIEFLNGELIEEKTTNGTFTIEYLKGLLPSSYLQTRDINFSYQTLRRICRQRKDHKLPQWKVFIDWCHTLPLSEELIFI